MWRFSLAAAGAKTQGGLRGLDRLKELQSKEGWLGQLGRKRMEDCWAVQGRISWGAVGGERRSSPSIRPWERAFPLLLHSAVVLVLRTLRAHHQSPSLCPHSSPAIPTTSPTPHSGSKAPCKRGRAGARLGSEAGAPWRRTSSSSCQPLVTVTPDPILIFLTVI